ncbi:MAG TPA: GNAT family N-acetyltransferase, partial [Micromonosporaceae bacterium]
AGLSIVSAAAVNIDRLRELDDVLRQDVPGTDGWRNDPDNFPSQVTDDPQFDPATHLVAVDDASGGYAGLVRVWVRTPMSRLGLIAVCAAYRRRGLAMALLAAAFGPIAARGEREVETEVDTTNVESNALMRRIGARRVGGAIELVRRAS